MDFLLRFALAAMLPGNDALPGSGQLDLAQFVSNFRQETTWLMWLGLILCALVFQLTPLLTIGVPLPALLLPARLLDKHADAMSEHSLYRLRQAAFLLKMVAGLHWGARPEVRTQLGLAPYGPDPGSWRSA